MCGEWVECAGRGVQLVSANFIHSEMGNYFESYYVPILDNEFAQVLTSGICNCNRFCDSVSRTAFIPFLFGQPPISPLHTQVLHIFQSSGCVFLCVCCHTSAADTLLC